MKLMNTRACNVCPQYSTARETGRVDIHIHNFVNKRGHRTALRA